jgi:hypothetical protein
MGICGMEAACVRKAPDEISVLTWTRDVPQVGHAGAGGTASSDMRQFYCPSTTFVAIATGGRGDTSYGATMRSLGKYD